MPLLTQAQKALYDAHLVAGDTIPSGWVNATNFNTSSGSFVDVTGASIQVTITNTAAYIWANAEVSWFGPSDSPVAEYRLVIGSENGDATSDPTHGNIVGTVGLNYRTSVAFAPGTYTVKLQARMVSGSGGIQVQHVDLFALALQRST